MKETGVVVYHHPNPEMKSFLTPVPISTPRVEQFKAPLAPESEPIMEELGTIGAQVVKDIMAIPGIRELRIKPKEILLKKEYGSQWETIEKPVLQILDRALRRKAMHIVRR